MSRETASQIGRVSNGCARAMDWSRIPIVRMVNVNLEPGDWKLDDLIADTEDGIFIDTNRSWSIDDRRYNFQFGTEIGYEIKHGKLDVCCAIPPTPASPPNSGTAVMQSVIQITGRCGAHPIVVKANPGRRCTPVTGIAPARFRKIKVGVF